MSPPALIITGLVIAPILLAVSLAYYSHRTLRAHRAQQRVQHQQWHRTNALDPDLPLTRLETNSGQASRPRSVSNDVRIPVARLTPPRTYPVPYWGPRDEWGPKDGPPEPRSLRPSGTPEKRSTHAAASPPFRDASALDGSATSASAYGTAVHVSVDPARDIWRKIALRERLG